MEHFVQKKRPGSVKLPGRNLLTRGLYFLENELVALAVVVVRDAEVISLLDDGPVSSLVAEV